MLRANFFQRRTCQLLALGVAALLLTGCPSTTQPPAAAPQAKQTPNQPPKETLKPAISEVTEQPAAPVEVKPVEPSSAQPAEVTSTQPSSTRNTPAEKPGEVSVAAPPPYGTERFLLMSTIGPLVVECRLSIDGAAHTGTLEKLVADVLKLADTNSDGQTKWDELCACEAVKYGQFGNLAIDGANGSKQVVEMYDIDRDGIVDTGELPRFLTRNAGGSRPFSLRSMGSFTDALAASELWQLLDVDGEGVISASDRSQIVTQLRSRDADDDDTIVAAEIASRMQNANMPGMQPERRRRRGIAPALLLGEHANWDAIRSSLEEIYALGGSLSADDFLRTSDLFMQLDLDKNERLARAEFKELDKVAPHLVLEVHFASSQERPVTTPASEPTPEAESSLTSRSAPPEISEPADEASPALKGPLKASPAPQMAVVQVAEWLKSETAVETLSPSAVRLVVAGVPIFLYHRDTVASTNFDVQAKFQVMQLDANNNGYLEPEELMVNPQANLRYESIDLDADKKVFPAELSAYLKTASRAVRSQIHARAQGLDEPLLLQLDANYDQRLDAAELLSAAERLAALDRNGDGDISIDEVPTGYQIVFARGGIENPDQLFTPDPIMPRPRTAGPVPDWFAAMDTSGDSLVTPREFLGPAELFTQIDTSADGLLTPDEAAAVTPELPPAAPENKAESAPTTSE